MNKNEFIYWLEQLFSSKFIQFFPQNIKVNAGGFVKSVELLCKDAHSYKILKSYELDLAQKLSPFNIDLTILYKSDKKCEEEISKILNSIKKG